MCIYRNDTSAGVAYRVGRPSRAMIAAANAAMGSTALAYFGNTGATE